jgi:hypothetical protein
MSRKSTLPTIAMMFLSSFATVSAGFAQDSRATGPAQREMMDGTNPAQHGQGMMGSTGDTAKMMNMMRQMTRMMENCNRMMESADQSPPVPEKPPAAQTPPG